MIHGKALFSLLTVVVVLWTHETYSQELPLPAIPDTFRTAKPGQAIAFSLPESYIRTLGLKGELDLQSIALFFKHDASGSLQALGEAMITECRAGTCSLEFKGGAALKTLDWKKIQTLYSFALPPPGRLEQSFPEDAPGVRPPKDKAAVEKWPIEAQARMRLASYQYKDKSSTVFNEFKFTRSRPLMMGADFFVGWHYLFGTLEFLTVDLPTKTFFESQVSSGVTRFDFAFGGRYRFWPRIETTGALSISTESFSTENTDEAIVPTSLMQWLIVLGAAYDIPGAWIGDEQSTSSFSIPRGKLSLLIRVGVLGKISDGGEFRRGSDSSHQEYSFRLSYDLTSRDSSLWFTGWTFGLWSELGLRSQSFSGETTPAGFAAGTSASPFWNAFGISLGRYHAFL